MRHFKNVILVVFISLAAALTTSAGEEILQKKIEERIKDFKGVAGIYVRNLKTGEEAEINADTLFPTASLIKVPILLKIFDKIENGELNYDSELIWYADSVNYPYDGGILYSFQDGKEITLSKIISLMITYSDNHASLWCQALAGGGEEINKWLNENGFKHTRVNSRTKGREKIREIYGWGQTTPREMAELLIMINERRAVSMAASEEMYRILCNIYWDGESLSQIPPYVQAASKQGAVDKSRSEVVLVNAPSGNYVFCVITKNQEDTSWVRSNEGYVLLRDISRLLWNYFEPDNEYIAPGELKYFK